MNTADIRFSNLKTLDNVKGSVYQLSRHHQSQSRSPALTDHSVAAVVRELRVIREVMIGERSVKRRPVAEGGPWTGGELQ
ncbi:hypothetical protein GCM10022261_01690 [Brevibacterium daeguense]|uniref:Uncharacterized protein n=1 Tax=Brevibacterium daeguense TaxID=909936 RepID=A0ABP8EFG5_9MICO